MPRVSSVRDLESDAFQRKEWRFQTVSRVVLGVVLVAAAGGFFGTGPLSGTEAGDDAGTITVRYERFVRHQGQAELTVSLGAGAVDGSSATLFLSRSLVDEMDIQNIDPQPASARSTEDGVFYTFEADVDSPPVVSVAYRPDGLGPVRGTVRAGSGEPVTIRQFAHP